MMFRKKLIILCCFVAILALIATPVSAKSIKPGKGPHPPLPAQAHKWELDITIVDPYIFDPNFPDQYLWSFYFHVTMPPVTWPVQVVLLREGVILPDYTFTFFYEDTTVNFAGPVWEIDPPESITYTFVLTAQGKTISENVIVYFD